MTTGFDYDVFLGHCKTCSVSRSKDLAGLWIVWVACRGRGWRGGLPGGNPATTPSVDLLVLFLHLGCSDFEGFGG